jgi:hypothetical protein
MNKKEFFRITCTPSQHGSILFRMDASGHLKGDDKAVEKLCVQSDQADQVKNSEVSVSRYMHSLIRHVTNG